MALFGIWGTKPKDENMTISADEIKPQESSKESGTSEENVKKEDEKNKVITITWGTGMPIDVIFKMRLSIRILLTAMLKRKLYATIWRCCSSESYFDIRVTSV